MRQQLLHTAEMMDKTAAVPEQLERAAAVEVGQTPSEVVYTENKLELHHYESRTETQYDVPILIIYALINRPYILDLQPSRSVVQTLLDRGFDVYLVDWGEPSTLDTTLTIDDYVERYIENCVEEVRERSGVDAINLLGYCMGGTMSVMYAALHPEKVRNLGLLAAGLCFDGTGGVLELWGDEEYYDPGALTETYGNVPAEFLDLGFAMMDPVENFVSKYVYFYDNLENDDFVENFARMERWLGDGIDVAGETYRQFLEDLYQDDLLAKSEMRVGGERIDLEEFDVPLLQIVGEYDHLIPPESSTLFNDLVASDDTDVIEFPTGHIGLSVSSHSHRELWPQVCEWFAERSQTDGDAADEMERTSQPEVDDKEVDDNEVDDIEVDDSETDGARDLEAIDGIGPAYAARLRDAGIESPSELAESDPDTVASATDIAPGRVRGWIDSVREAILEESDADSDTDRTDSG